ncbi:myb-like transcription factor family protein [Euphorbia peplus]|nr:myb-like transcription factor family protein [Euphorbia peplus]
MKAFSEKTKRCHGYVMALEEERRKIQVFQRELPLCLELVTQAIEASKKILPRTTTEYMHEQSEECSEQTNSSEETRLVVLEEFMPIKRTNASFHNDDDDDDEDDDDHSHMRINNKEKLTDHTRKSEWLKSVQLWNNQSPDPPVGEVVPRKALVMEVKQNGGAFQPFHKEKTTQAKSNQIVARKPASSSSSTAETTTVSGTGGDGDGSHKKAEEKDSHKKQRRCWSSELHRRFLYALQQLGGSHTATPKQIRELMKVDGLSNDEVKSHLQKYRLHTRRPAPTIHNNSNTQAPQFLVVGGIWVPPPEYAASAGEKAANKLYAPVAAPLVSNKSEEERGSHSEGQRVRSSSPSTSSCTHTTTNSPL